jgi:hypothetical protein
MAFRAKRLHVQLPCGDTRIEEQPAPNPFICGVSVFARYCPPYISWCLQHHTTDAKFAIAPQDCLDVSLDPQAGLMVDAEALPALREQLQAQLDAVVEAEAKLQEHLDAPGGGDPRGEAGGGG